MATVVVSHLRAPDRVKVAILFCSPMASHPCPVAMIATATMSYMRASSNMRVLFWLRVPPCPPTDAKLANQAMPFEDKVDEATVICIARHAAVSDYASQIEHAVKSAAQSVLWSEVVSLQKDLGLSSVEAVLKTPFWGRLHPHTGKSALYAQLNLFTLDSWVLSHLNQSTPVYKAMASAVKVSSNVHVSID